VKILVLTRYGRLGASSRLRSLQFLPLLKEMGISCTVQPLFSDVLLNNKYKNGNYELRQLICAYVVRLRQLFKRKEFDLIWIEKEALPWFPAFVEKALLHGVPYVLDYDDALFHNYDLHSSKWIRLLYGRRIDCLMAEARLVMGGNDYLLGRALNAGASWVEHVPTVIDLDRYVVNSCNNLVKDVPHIVWVGSPSTVKYLAALEEPLLELSKNINFKLRVIGGIIKMPGVNLECIQWTENNEVDAIIQCDIGIMPLTDSPWERGKCGYKLIQYMACGLPVVASPVGVNTQIVSEGVNGFLVDGAIAWKTKLELLLGDSSLRIKMGKAGRQKVERKYCIQSIGVRLAVILAKAAKL